MSKIQTFSRKQQKTFFVNLRQCKNKMSATRGKQVQTRHDPNVTFNLDTSVKKRMEPTQNDTLRLGDVAPTGLQRRKTGGRKSTQKKKAKCNKRDTNMASLPPVQACTLKICKLNCATITNDPALQQSYRELYTTVCKNAPESSHNEGLRFLLSMLHGLKAS